MNLPKKLRNIALTQINAIKERLDRIDDEQAADIARSQFERDARAELDDHTDIRLPMQRADDTASTRSPAPSPPMRQAHATGRTDTTNRPCPPSATVPEAPPIARHYKVLGVEEGADFTVVHAAYSKLAARCAPDRFAVGTDERATAEAIRKRVDQAYDALRDALDPTAGRFDKLEF